MKNGAASSGTSPVVNGAIVVLLAAVVVGSYLMIAPGPAVPQPGRFQTSVSTIPSTSGLELGLALNATSLAPGQTLSVSVMERNTQGTVNNVQAANDWAVRGLALGPCGSLNDPMGILIARGNYSASTILGAQPLSLYQPGAYACPMVLADITGYSFQPLSDNATVVTGSGSGAGFNVTLFSNLDFRGYWGDSAARGTFTDFPAGVYTVVAGDEWGALTVLHFQVTSG